MDEGKLIQLIQRQGDRQAADQLIRFHYDEIFRYVNRQLGGQDLALDLTQEIFISLLRTLGHFDERQGSFRTWLYRIATNKLIDWFRSADYQSRQRTVEFTDLTISVSNDFVPRLRDIDWLSDMMSLVAQESIESQRIFRLHIFGDYTFRQIAEILNLPESTIKTKYYRLKARLQTEVSSND